jgi:hypothetical protein
MVQIEFAYLQVGKKGGRIGGVIAKGVRNLLRNEQRHASDVGRGQIMQSSAVIHICLN